MQSNALYNDCGGVNVSFPQVLAVTSYKLQVTSYKLQVTSYKLQVTSYKCYELRVASYELKVTSYELRVTSYKLQVSRASRSPVQEEDERVDRVTKHPRL